MPPFTAAALPLLLVMALTLPLAAAAQNRDDADVDTSNNPIVIGASLPLTGPNAAAGQEGLSVVKAVFDRINRGGGIQGRRLVLQALDDGFDPARAAANARQLAEGKAVALFNCWGTASCSAVLPVVNEQKLALVSGIAGGGPMRANPGRYAFNVRPTTTDEVARMVQQMTTVGQTRVVVVYQDDGFGKSALAAGKPVFERAKLTPLAELPLAADASTVPATVAKIGQADANAVLLLASPRATVALAKALREAGKAMPIYNLAAQATRKVVADLGARTQGMIFSTLVPSPWRRRPGVVQDYQDAVRAATGKDEFSYLGLEVFINARLLEEGLRQAGRKLDRESLVNALDSMGERSYGDVMRVRWSPGEHGGSRYVGITIINRDGQFIE